MYKSVILSKEESERQHRRKMALTRQGDLEGRVIGRLSQPERALLASESDAPAVPQNYSLVRNDRGEIVRSWSF